MCKLCTPLLALAAGGLIQGLGIAMNPVLSGAVNGLVNGGISGAAQGALGGAVSSGLSAITQSISQIPPFLTGMPSNNFVDFPPAGINLSSPNNLFSSITGQANNLLQNGARGFTEIFQGAAAHIDSAFNLSGSLEALRGYNINEGELGFTVNSWNDIVTGGFTSQFPGMPGEGWTPEQWAAQFSNDQSAVGFKDMVSGLKNNLGSFYGSVTDTLTSFSPASIVNNWVNQGLGNDVLPHLEKYGISYEQLASGQVDTKVLTSALDQMPSNMFKNIVINTGLTAATGAVISKFSDALRTNNVLGATVAAGIGVPLMNDLGQRMFNLIGYNHSYTGFPDIANTLSQLRTSGTSAISALTPANFTSFVTAGLAAVGTGSGTFGNPKMTDMIGALAGDGYNNRLASISTLNTQILGTAQGQALLSALQAAQGATQENASAIAAQITSAAQPFISPGNSQLAADVAAGTAHFSQMYNKLVNEKVNLRLAELVNSSTGNIEAKGGTNSVIGFASGLHQYHNDESNLGMAQILNLVTSNDVTGEAIRAGIVEGRNLALLQQRGVYLDTRSDPVELSKQLLNPGST